MLKYLYYKIKGSRSKGLLSVLALAAMMLLLSPVANAAEQETVNLRLMETSDIHVNLVNYDYYKDAPTDEYGLIKTANLIKKARAETTNAMLFDNGDLIQGNPLGDYVANVDPLQEGEIHPVYQVMNQMNYDAANIGNHEFNYGLDFLSKSLSGANFPYVNANVYVDDGDTNPANDQNKFTPYKMLEKQVTDNDGDTHTINVGVIGFVPPQVMQWDKENLKGNVITKGIVETANKFIPQMQEDGADVVVAIAHSGIGTVTQDGMEENATYDLTKIDGIDAILFGHSHGVFPSEDYADIEGVNIDKGTINGVPAVMPGYWGSHVGIIDLQLKKMGDSWEITDGESQTRGIIDENGNPTVEANQALFEEIKNEHQATLEYIRGPVGETTAPINSYFAQVQDDPSVQIVSNAQTWYIENYIQGTEYDGLPVLSAAAPFKAGTRGDPGYYTDIPAGTIAIKNVADLYLYPNTLRAVLVKGDELREWLEMSAGQFNQIDPNTTEEQELVNMNYRSYNFDIIDGVEYQVDVTQPARYNAGGELINADAHRVVNLTYQGEKVGPDQKFVVATNNYRAGGGGNFPGFAGDIETIVSSPDENRQAIIDYIRETGVINPSADMNWTFAPIEGETTVTFETSPEAQKYAADMENIQYQSTLQSGFAKYTIDLNELPTEMTYVVQPKDTIGKIAARYGIHWKEIYAYNELESKKLQTGQELKIPMKLNDGATLETYVVQDGDTIGKIASRYNVHWKDIARVNLLLHPHKLKVGQELLVPVKQQ